MEKEIINESWFPLVRELQLLAKVKRIVMLWEEDTDAAGMFDPENDCIIVNMAPNVLAEVASRYDLTPRELEKTALCVYLEECAHSAGIIDENAAVITAKAMATMVPEYRIRKKGGVAAYVRSQLEKGDATADAQFVRSKTLGS